MKKTAGFCFAGSSSRFNGIGQIHFDFAGAAADHIFMMKRRYDIVFSPYMFLAALIAFIMITPVIYWNVTHDFISFRYQGGHVFGTFASSFKNFAESLAAQFGAYGPFLFIIAFYGFFKALRSQSVYLRLPFYSAALLWYFFCSLHFMSGHFLTGPAFLFALHSCGNYFSLAGTGKMEKKLSLFFSRIQPCFNFVCLR